MKPQTAKEFTDTLVALAQRAFLKLLADGSWLTIDYSRRIKVEATTLATVYDSIDMERVKAKLIDKLEDKLADKIFNALATEVATDVKSIMSNTELREECRSILRNHMKSAVKNIVN